jgi:hypothetical protein
MKVLPKTDNPLVIRTDFETQQTWEKICELIRAPVHDRGETFYAYLNFLDDVEFRNVTKEDLLASVPRDYNHSFLLVVDATAMESRDFPILVIDLHNEPGRTFRAIPSQTQSIENNLSIANMDFSDFADAVDTEGVFRGFPETLFLR